jgi:phosphoribosylformimino-5-aminoimidazole carboxamide ribonucleotide (ProFAR) isomerase
VGELLDLWRDEPIGAVVATCIARDGMLEGPDLEGLAALASRTPLPVIASGGVSTLADLVALAGIGLTGVIVGKALVEGRFSVKEAVVACAPSA